MKLPAAPLTERTAADPQAGPPQPEAPPDALFAALLDIQTARTAPAEGQTPDTPDTPTAAQPTDGTLLAELAAALPLPAAVTPPVPPAPVADPLAATAKTPAPATPAVPAHRAADEPAGPEPAPAPQPDAPAKAKPNAKSEANAQSGLHSKADPAPRAEPATPATPSEHAKTQPTSDTPAKPAAEVQPATAPPAKDAAPTPRAEPPVAPVKDRPVTHSVSESRPTLRGERVEALVRLATRHGAAEARMELHPQELGSVVVRLRMTSDGLSATFTASNPEAIPQLQQAGDDLRRSLEAKGLTLATLDVRAQGDDAGPAGERRHGHGTGRRTADPRDVEDVDDEPITSITTTVPAGALVDVHA